MAMAKVTVDWHRYLVRTLSDLNNGGLLLSSVSPMGKPNAMTIGWAAFGVMWGRPTAVVMVRPSRFTYECIEATRDFAVNVPYPRLSEAVKFCGTKSGRDLDKFTECSFTPLPIEGVRSPGIAECAVTYYCRVLHKNDVQPRELDEEVVRTCYPTGDYHRYYYGEIVAVVADPDFGQ